MGSVLTVGVVSGILHPSYGGPFSVVVNHVEALRARGDVAVEVFGVAPGDDLGATRARLPGAQVFPMTFPRRWFRGAGLAEALTARAPHIDVWHAHMLWDAPVLAAARLARRLDRPLVITPHGSVSAAWRRGAPHKRAYQRWLLGPALGPRTALHALNAHEAEALRAWTGGATAVRVVPNGLPAARFAPAEVAPARARWPALAGRRVMLYLGRLWGEKGLDWLPEAFAESGSAGVGSGAAAADADDGWDLVIAGPDYRGYAEGLRARIARLGAASTPRVHLVGSVDGAEKWALLNLAELFVLPSRGEGFSMALLEAMAAGTPALYTDACHQPDLAAAGGGVEVPVDRVALVAALRRLRGAPPEDLAQMGAAARALGRDRYTAEAVAAGLVDLYRGL